VENIQKPFCYAFVIVSQDNEIVYESSYAGADANVHFLNALLDLEENWLEDYFGTTLDMEPIIVNKSSATHCFLCLKSFTEKDVKVRGK